MSIRTWVLLAIFAAAGGCGFFAGTEGQIAAAEKSLAAGDYGAAAVTLRNVVQKNPADGRAQLLLARTQYMRGDAAAAQAALAEAAKHKADAVASAELHAQLAIDANRFSELLADIDAGRIALPPAKAELFRARALQGQGSTVEALARYERLLQAEPANADLRLYAAECHLTLGRPTLARQQIDQALAAKPDAAAAWAARSALLEGTDLAESRDSLRKAIEYAPGQLRLREQVALIAREIGAQLAAGDLNAAQTGHKALVALAPQAPLTGWLATQISLAKGDAAAAVSGLQHLLQQGSGLANVRPSLIGALLVTGDNELALHEMGNLVGDAPDNARLKNLQDALKQVASAPAGSVQRVMGATMIATSLDQIAAAQQIVEAGLKAQPDALPLLAAAIQLQLRMGQNTAALERARALYSRRPDDPGSLGLLAMAQLANHDTAGAMVSYERLWEDAPTASIAIALAQLRLREHREDAVAPLEQWLDKHPQEIAARILLAQAAQEQNQLGKAETQYEQILAQQPQNPTVLNNLAWIYFLRKDPRALATAKRAYDRGAANPLIADTYGWLLAESGDNQSALPILRKAAQMAPGGAAIRYHLAAVLARGSNPEDYRQARLFLTDLLRDPAPAPWRADAEKLLASLPAA